MKKKYSSAFRHFSKPEDSLKLKALYFLLANLRDQYFFQGNWIDRYDSAILKKNSNSVSDLIKARDSINQFYPSSLTRIPDDALLTDSFFIQTIDNAFETRNFPWSKNISFEDFCEYVLPYKVGNEKPESWGTCLSYENYLNRDSLKGLKNGFQAAAYINDHLNWIRTTGNYDYPIDIGYKMSRYIATGTCYTQSRIALFEMRAIGLPGVIDYAASWGNRSSGHSWNAIMIDNRPYPFDPTGPDIGFYKVEFKGTGRMPYKISKVFRQTFSIQSGNPAEIITNDEAVPTQLQSRRIKDVTPQYVPTSDLLLKYRSDISRKFAYLFTFDDRTWIPSFWGAIDKNKITFKNMGRDIVYLPALYNAAENAVPIGYPFILKADGTITELSPDSSITQTLLITKKYPEDETNNIVKGNKYELLYWDYRWKSLGLQIADSNFLKYNNAPKNALYLVKNLTKGKQERIFTYANNEQVWW